MSLLDARPALTSPGRVLKPARLSKSKFVAGVQCLKRLYSQLNPPEGMLPITDESDKLQQGHEVDELARAAFPGGIVVDSGDALARTAALVDDMSVPAIFEAAFRFEGIT